jgi:hypothetical protein
MNYGALKTLLTMLQSAPSLRGVSVLFGEEMIAAQDSACPVVVMVPGAGQWGSPGYIQDVNPSVEMIWATTESIDLYCWAAATGNDSPIDNADAVEVLRARVLQAFQLQLNNGLAYRPVSGRWLAMGNSVNRFGRAYVLTVQVDIGIPAVLYPDATVTQTTLNPSI